MFVVIIQEWVHTGSIGSPVAQNTTLGWILTFSSHQSLSDCNSASHILDCSKETENLNYFVIKFWELETVPNPPSSVLMSPDELEYEKYFNISFSRNMEGRFIVRLPFRTKDPVFPQSYQMASRSYIRLQSRLSRNQVFKRKIL